MTKLLLRPERKSGLIHQVTPKSAKWRYVGMSIYSLDKGEEISGFSKKDEVIIVIIEGKSEIEIENNNYGILGERMNVFEQLAPHSVYVPNQTNWKAFTVSKCTLAVCTAPGRLNYEPKILDRPELIQRGKGSNTRYINNIAMESDDVADSLLVTEVFTPPGNWSSYPPHRHDEDNFPHMTYLEETYYHRLNPEKGYGIQQIWTDDGSLDETYKVRNQDVVLVPKGYHPCGVPYGYEMYYLNVMAGPIRKWRFKNDPDHNWIYERDNKIKT